MHLPQGKRYGLIAEEVEELLPGLVKNTMFKDRSANLDSTHESNPSAAQSKEKIDFKAVNYTELIPIMIKGMQEQQAENQALQEENKNQQRQIDELRQMVLELKNGRTGPVTITSAYLEQNSPNPVNGSTVIRYRIPETSTSARLILTNAKGQIVKMVNINNKGTGQLSLNTISLAAGTYNYTLYVDGRQVDAKRLVISR
jgi:hypothetical protein